MPAANSTEIYDAIMGGRIGLEINGAQEEKISPMHMFNQIYPPRGSGSGIQSHMISMRRWR
jgi:hypothetical protein